MRPDIEQVQGEKSISMSLPKAAELRFPGPLVSLEDVFYRYSLDSGFILKSLSLNIHMGDRVGIVGGNGCGKSTLIKLVTDIMKPSRGNISRHPRLRLGYYSQHSVEELSSLAESTTSTALSLLAAEAGEQLMESDVRALLGSLGLSGRVASDVPIGKLSGGQRVSACLYAWGCSFAPANLVY